MRLPPSRRTWVRVALSLAAAAVADALFLHVGLGVNAALFAVLLLAALLFAGSPGMARRDRGTVLCLGLLAAVPLVEEPSPLALALAGTYLALAAVTSRQGWERSIRGTVQRLLTFAILAPFQWIVDGLVLLRGRRAAGGEAPRLGPVLRWVGPLALTGLFLVLLTVANPVIARSLGDVGRWFQRQVEAVDAVRVAFWMAVAAGVWALLRVRVRPQAVPAAARGPVGSLRTATVVRCLLLSNVLFLVQNVLDLRYLWLGRELPEGMTYAQYAHRGAYPLVATALLAGVFALAAFPSGGEASTRRAPRLLVFLFLLQNALLTVCAAQRLHLYVEAYDLTRLRVAAAAWMLLVLFGLLTILWRILRHRSRRWLVGVNVAALVALLQVAALSRVDEFVADYNVEHSREMGGHGLAVDLPYLAELGTDALPALERLATKANSPAVREKARALAEGHRKTLRRQVSDWRTWTLRRRHLLQL